MGMFRKLTSVTTLGLVDMRSAKDRTARSTAKGAKYTKKQYKLMKRAENREAVAALFHPTTL